MRHSATEKFGLTLHDRDGALIHSLIREGDLDKIRVRYRELIEPALRLGASGILLFHNHPSGNSSASQTDIQSTRSLAALCGALDIKLYDHLIVAGENITSMRAERLLANFVKMRQSADPELPPCVTVANSPPAPDPIPVPPPVVQVCPCWTPGEANAIDGVLSNASTAFGWPAPTSSGAACGADPGFPYISEEGPVDGLRERVFIRVVDLDSVAMHYCHYQKELKGTIDTVRVMHVSEGALTLEQLADCKADLLARQAALGLCQPTP